MLQVASNLFILQLFFCCLIFYSSLPSAFCSSASDCWTPTSALKLGHRGQAPHLAWEGDLDGQCTHNHSGEASHGHSFYGKSTGRCTSWCRVSRSDIEASLTCPPNFLDILTGSAGTTNFFPLFASSQTLQLVGSSVHSRWDKKVSFVERFGMAAYPRVISGHIWKRDTKASCGVCVFLAIS